jgi:hypothetical protein
MATLTINTTGAQDARIAPAFGALLNLGGNANTAQVKAKVIRYITDVVLTYEQGLAQVAAAAAVTEITPT